MKNDKKKAGNRGHDKSPKGVKDGLGGAEAKLYYNQETGATNFPAWSERQILKIKAKLGAHVEDSIIKGKWIPRKFVADELNINYDGEEDEARSEGGDTEGDGEGSNSSSSASSNMSAGGSRRRSAATTSSRSQSISARAELEKMLKEKHYEEAIKVHAKKVSDDRDACEKYCGDLLLDINPDSLALIQCQERYETVKNDLVKLFMLIREVHVTRRSKDPQLDKLRKENRLVALAQGQWESLAQYRKRFEREYAEAKEMGAEVGTEQTRVFKFVDSISRAKYGGYVSRLMQDRALCKGDSDIFPKSIAECCDAAVAYAKADRSPHEKQISVIYNTVSDKGKTKAGNSSQGSHGKDSNGGSAGGGKPSDKSTKRVVICWSCNQEGHIKRDCPMEKDIDDAVDEELAAETESDLKPVKKAGKRKGHQYFTVNVAKVCGLPIYTKWIVILDSGANVSGVNNPDLLSDIRKNSSQEPISGIEGGEFVPEWEGDLVELGMTVKYDKRFAANIVALSSMRDTADNVYFCKEQDQFEVYIDSNCFAFERYNGVYVCDLKPERVKGTVLVTTAVKNEAMFSPREVKAARGVRELMMIRGLTSMSEMQRLLMSGAILNCPYTEQDVVRAQQIYGPDIASLKGKTKRSKGKRVLIDTLSWRPIRAVQVMLVDLFCVCGVWFLLSLTTPLKMLMVTHLPEGKRMAGVFTALMAHIDAYKGRMFQIAGIRSDGEGAIVAIRDRIERLGVHVDVVSKEEHVPEVERYIGICKERCRGIIHSLPFRLSRILVVWLVYYVVIRVNQSLFDKTPGAVPPFCNFKLRKIDHEIDYRIGFGEYVQVHEDNGNYQNSMMARTTGAIALCPTGNLSGSVKFLSLSTWKVITRDKWTEVPMPQDVVLKLNAMAANDATPIPRELVFQYRERDVPIVMETPAGEPVGYAMRDPDDVLSQIGVEDGVISETDEQDPDPVFETGVDSGVRKASDSEPEPQIEQEPSEQAEDLVEQESVDDVEDTVLEPEHEQNVRRSSRAGLPVDYKALNRRGYEGALRGRVTYYTMASDRVKTSKYLSKALDKGLNSRMHMFHISVKEALKRMPKAAVKSIVKEVINVWGNGKNMHPVSMKSLTMRQRRSIIRSCMFLKEKFLPTGDFEKLKSRLVALGNMQDESLYSEEETSSPTVSLLAVYTLAAVGKSEKRVFKTLDVVGAYLKSDIGEKEVLVMLDKFTARVLAKVAPEVKPFLTDKEELVVRLDSALYGCVQSAKQWYKEISSFLVSIGLERNRMDDCIFNKTTLGGKQLTVLLHVDDMMMSCVDEGAIDEVIDQLKEKYVDVTVCDDQKALPFLGMVFDFTDPVKLRITMDKYVEDVLKLYKVSGYAKTPAGADLFEVDEVSSQLDEEKAEYFHSRVAKLLYLAKRVRPELLPAVIFLTTRVNCATEQDWNKLERVLKYLNKYPKLGIGLSVGEPMCVIGYIDASFGVHADYKSHTGAMVSVGGGPVVCDSSKQKTNAKSSYEAELMGATDGSNSLFFVRNLLIEQGYKLGAAKLYQDNQSALASLKNGKPTSKRSRHINIRYFYLKDKVDTGELELEYLATDEMIADILTKPLQGEKFKFLRGKLLNFD